VEATCTHVAVLQAGTLVAAGELRTLLDCGAAGLVIVTPDVELALRTLREAGISAYLGHGVEPAVVVGEDGPPTPETISLLVRSGVAVHEARRSRPNLDDLFAQLTEETA
jgi:ABC-2 type transport system ATP-binding protein